MQVETSSLKTRDISDKMEPMCIHGVQYWVRDSYKEGYMAPAFEANSTPTLILCSQESGKSEF